MTIEILKQIWPEWQVEEKPLGKGSFGVVYKAVRRDHNVESFAAIKAISIPSDSSEVDSLRSEGLDMDATKTYLQGIVDDFVSEIQLMESLKGVQNIVSVEDYKVIEKTGEIGWDIYIRMELLTPFNAYICDKKMTEDEVIKLGCDICTALEICSQRNIIHRDIKPENIFINDFGHFKLGDFGIARKMENMTGGLSQKGTFNYMAPEVATSRDYDARVDTYSLGIVLYRLLNGNRLPFLDTEKQLLNPNERRNAIDRRIRGEKLPAPCEASPAMADLILCACAHDPNMRFASAAEMKQALMSAANGTYQAKGAVSLDKKSSPRTEPDDPDKTTPLYETAAASNQRFGQSVATFGTVPNKNNKKTAVIAGILAAVVLAGVGIFAVPKLTGNNGNDAPNIAVDGSVAETTSNSAFEEAENTNTDTDASDSQVKADTLEKAAGLADSGDYVSAIAIIKSALNTYGDDADYQNAYNMYITFVRNEAIASANDSAANGEYINAIRTVEGAIAVIGDDAELETKIDEYENSYVDSIIEYAYTLIAEEDYDAVDEVINAAVQEIPNNAELTSKLKELENIKPVSITALTPLNVEEWEWNNGAPVDPFGNDYSSSCNYAILPGISYNNKIYSIEYRVDSAYKKFKGVLAPYTSIGEDSYAYMQIFINDVLAYTSPLITRKTDAFSFDIDVSEADYIKIQVYDGKSGSIIISDVQLYPASMDISSAIEGDTNSNIKPEAQNEPISATTLTALNKENWTWNEGIPKDLSNTDYTYVCNYAILNGISYNSKEYSIEYRTDGEYTDLCSVFAPYTTMEENGYAYIQIFADDVLVYTSPNITWKTDADSFDVDISGAKYVKIYVYNSSHSSIILSDVTLR